MPESPARAAAAQTPPRAAPPPARTPFALDLDLQEFALQPEYVAGEALVGDEDVGAHAQERQRQPGSPKPPPGRAPGPLRSGRGRRSAPGPRSARSCTGTEARSRRSSPPRAESVRAIGRREPGSRRPRDPPATSSATTPHPPRSACRRPIPRGLRTSSRRNSANAAAQAQRRASGHEEDSGAGQELARDLVDDDAARVLGLEGAADGPGDEHSEQADGQAGHQQSDRRPKMPACGTRDPRPAARPTTEPAVPGATGESPEPKPVARRVRNGCARNARRASDIDTGSCRREDPSVLIASCSAFPESIIAQNRARIFPSDRER